MSSEQVVEALKPNSNVPLKDKISILEEFSRALKEPVSREQSQAIFSSTPLDLFYYGFSLEQEKLTEILCQVVNKLMGPLSYQEIPFKFLVEGLTHYDAQIRFLSIQQVFKCLESIDFIKSMVQSEIFMHVIITLSFQDTKTAQKANELLFQISRHIPEALFGTSSILHQLLTVSETVKFRIYELMIKVASESDQAFESCEKTGLLEAYLNELQSQDLLVKLNAIEMLNEIAATASGIRFLEKARLVEDMSAVLKDQDEDVVVSLVKCALIKFLGNLGENTQVPFQKLSNDYGILENLSGCLDSSNEEVVIVTISSIGLIGSHLKGLALLLSETDLVNVLANMYLSVVGSVKAVLIQTLSKLIGVRQEPESELLTQDVFKQWNGFPERLIRDAKQPDDSIRIASFALMQSIAYHSWGIESMAQSGPFLQYLLDRSTDHIQQGQIWKYTIIQTCISHPSSKQLMTDQDYDQLQLYIHQGPFYKPLETTVAFESS